jgi:hypothetical protein
MNGPGPLRPLVRGVERWHAPILLAIPTLLLAFLGNGSRLPEALVGLAGIGLSSYLSTRRDPAAVDGWALPALLTTGAVALLAGVSLPAEVLAGVCALAAVYWIATDTPGLRLAAGASYGLLLPGLAVGLALAVTLFLPAGPAEVGVASVILVVLFLGVAAVLGGWSSPSGSD